MITKAAFTPSLPTLPCKISATADGETAAVGTAEQGQAEPSPGSGAYEFLFKGTAPAPLLPMLQQMVRFPRPYITWDLFNSAPPLTFPDTTGQGVPGSRALKSAINRLHINTGHSTPGGLARVCRDAGAILEAIKLCKALRCGA